MHCQKMADDRSATIYKHVPAKICLTGDSVSGDLRIGKIMDHDTTQTNAGHSGPIWTRSMIVTVGVVN